MKSPQKHWKELSKSAVRLNSKLGGSRVLPSKFAPTHDHSRSSDKLFDRSLERYQSSLELTFLSKGKEEHQGPKLLKISTVGANDSPENRNSLMGQPTSVDEKKQSLIERKQMTVTERKQLKQLFQESERHAQMVVDLRKEYLMFKKNILMQIDRQREMVHRIIKEIVLTVEFEIEKITKLTQQMPSQHLLQPKISPDLKTLEDWKNTLSTVSLVEKPPRAIQISGITPQKGREKASQVQILPAPKAFEDLDLFLSDLNRLKGQISELDSLLCGGVEGPLVSPACPRSRIRPPSDFQH